MHPHLLLLLLLTGGAVQVQRQRGRSPGCSLTALRSNTTLDWTFLSPPALLAPGERTGRYRVGGEDLLMDDDQPAGISVADLAVAVADEIERPRHLRARFTVATRT